MRHDNFGIIVLVLRIDKEILKNQNCFLLLFFEIKIFEKQIRIIHFGEIAKVMQESDSYLNLAVSGILHIGWQIELSQKRHVFQPYFL